MDDMKILVVEDDRSVLNLITTTLKINHYSYIAASTGNEAVSLCASHHPGLILLAFGLGIYTTLLPQVCRRVFGSREYAAIWSLIATVGSVGTFVATPVWGLVYDITGSYTLGLIAAPVMLMVALGALILIFRKTER